MAKYRCGCGNWHNYQTITWLSAFGDFIGKYQTIKLFESVCANNKPYQTKAYQGFGITRDGKLDETASGPKLPIKTKDYERWNTYRQLYQIRIEKQEQDVRDTCAIPFVGEYTRKISRPAYLLKSYLRLIERAEQMPIRN